MRMWMTAPSLMCRQHLLGEHRELHALAGILEKGISVEGYVSGGLAEPYRIVERHATIEAEMIRRGWEHASPLSGKVPYGGPAGCVDVLVSYTELRTRCEQCRELQDKHRARRRSLSPSSAAEYEWCGVAWARNMAGDAVPEDTKDAENEIRLRHGSAWHHLIDKWLEKGTFERQELVAEWRPTLERFLGGYMRHDLAKQLLRGAYPFLTNFHKRLLEVGLLRPTLLQEKRLSMPIALTDWTITGQVDAVWQHGAPTENNGGGIIELVDWKTNRGVKSEETLLNDWQLKTYALLLMHQYGVDRVQATLHYVCADKRRSVMFERRQIEMQTKLRYSRIADKMERNAHTPADDEKCWECPFTKAGRPCVGSPPGLQTKSTSSPDQKGPQHDEATDVRG